MIKFLKFIKMSEQVSTRSVYFDLNNSEKNLLSYILNKYNKSVGGFANLDSIGRFSFQFIQNTIKKAEPEFSNSSRRSVFNILKKKYLM